MGEDVDHQLKAAKAALRRARRHLKASDELSASRKYGQALSILILGLEELAKAIFLRLVVEGVVSTTPHIPAPLGRLRNRDLRLHWLKQTAIGALVTGLYVRARLNMLFLKFEGREPTDAEVDLLLPRILENAFELPLASTYKQAQHKELWRISRDLQRVMKLLGSLEDIKQAGFYVDVDLGGGPSQTLRRNARADYRLLRGLANGVFPFGGWMVEYGYTEAGKAHILELALTERPTGRRTPQPRASSPPSARNRQLVLPPKQWARAVSNLTGLNLKITWVLGANL